MGLMRIPSCPHTRTFPSKGGGGMVEYMRREVEEKEKEEEEASAHSSLSRPLTTWESHTTG